MCRSSSLIFIALVVSSVNCKPLETQNAATAPQSVNTSAILSDPKLTASFAQFVQQYNAQTVPVQVEPPAASQNSTPVIQSQNQAQAAPSVDTRAPFPAEQPQIVAQQPSAIQAQPQIQQVTTVPASQNLPLQQPSVAQNAATAPQSVNTSAILSDPKLMASFAQFVQQYNTQTVPVQVQPPSAPQNSTPGIQSQNQAQAAQSVDTRAPFRAEQPQIVAQQPPAIQGEPQIQQVSTIPASQNLPSQQPPVAQNAATAPQSVNTSAILSDPKLMASFAQFVQQYNAQTVPVQVQPPAASQNSTPVIQSRNQDQAAPSVDTRAPFPAEQPQIVAQQPSAIQAQPQIQQVTTVPASQNLPSQQPLVVQNAATAPQSINTSAILSDPKLMASFAQFVQQYNVQTVPIQVQPPAASQNSTPVIQSQNQAQAAPSVDTRAPFPAEQPQIVAQQPSAIQAQPQIQQVTTVPASQNLPLQQPSVAQNAATAPQSVNTSAILSDPKLMASFAQFVQQYNTQRVPVQVEPPAASQNSTPVIQSQNQAQAAPSVDTRAPFPAEQPQIVAQQPSAIQAQPQIQQVSTIPASQNLPLQQPPVAQNAATAPQSVNTSAILSDPKLMTSFSQFVQQYNAQRVPVQVQPPAASQNSTPVIQSQNQDQAAPSVDTRAPFPAEQPQVVAQQPPAIQGEPQIQQVSTIPASQNLPSQQPPVAQNAATAPQSINTSSILSDPKLMASFAQFVQQYNVQTVPIQVQPPAASQNSTPVIQSQNQAQAAPSVDTRAPFPAEQPQVVAHQPTAIQAQPQIQQVTTVPASQNLPLQQPPVAQNAATAPQSVNTSAVLSDPKFLASFAQFLQQYNAKVTPPAQQPSLVQETVPVQVQPQDTPQVLVTPNPTTALQAQNQSQAGIPQWPSQQLQELLNLQPSTNTQWSNTPIQVAAKSQDNVLTQQWGNVRIITRPRTYVYTPDPLTPEQQKKQAMSANYQFSTYVDDNIEGSFMARAEVRNGLKVNGQYGYDDGFVQRMVFYEADDKGYRIVKDTMNPSNKTGKLDGIATVQTIQDGTQVDYTITRKDIGNSNKVS